MHAAQELNYKIADLKPFDLWHLDTMQMVYRHLIKVKSGWLIYQMKVEFMTRASCIIK